MEQGCFLEFCKSRYIPVASFHKDQETRLYKFTKEAKSNKGHNAKRRSMSKEGRSISKEDCKQSLSPNGKANEGNPMQASHLYDLSCVSGLPVPLTPDRD